VTTSFSPTTLDRERHKEAIPSRGQPAPHIPPRHQPAHRIATDTGAIEIARRLAQEFALESPERDRERRLPIGEIDRFSAVPAFRPRHSPKSPRSSHQRTRASAKYRRITST
jgi:hypothetical protein